MKVIAWLIPTFFFLPHLCAQNNPRNLDFEQKGEYNTIYPWQKTSFSKQKKYLVTLDSIVQHGGRNSLRFTYDTVSKGISDGTAHNTLALDVIGKKLKFSAYVRQSNPDDTAGLISCIVSQDKGEKKLAVRGHSIIHAKDWTLLSREFDLDTFNLPVHHLRLNILASGKDTFWIDDLQLEVDGKNIYATPSFASARNETITAMSAQQVTNLKFLCYAWGFLKYFHPRIAKGNYNWDSELFKIIPAIKKAASDKVLSETLLTWINSFGEIPVCSNCYTDIPDSLFTKNFDLEWMKSNSLTGELRDKLQHILANRHLGPGYYVEYRTIKNLTFLNEQDYGNWREIGYPNEMFRLQFLFHYWNIIHYFFPYKYVIGKDWNEVLSEFLPRFAEARDYISYHMLMTEFVNSVNDSHSGISDVIVQKELAPLGLPVKITIIKDKAVVAGFKNDSLGYLSGLQTGDVIEKINGRTIKSIINERIRFVNGSNYPVKLAFLNAYNYITGGKDSVVKLDIKRGKNDFSLTTKRYGEIKTKSLKDSIRWKILPGNIGYVNMGLLEIKNVDSMFNDLFGTRAIIFDLRHYPASTVYDMCKYLYAQPTAFAKSLCPNLDYPGTFMWKGNIVYGSSARAAGTSHYKGKVVLLVNENTQSRAEWTAMAFQAVPGAVTIGSQTSGADGDVSHLYLAGNYHANMTGLGVFYPDETPTQRVGIRVDITVYPTVQGIREKKDEVFEKALEILRR